MLSTTDTTETKGNIYLALILIEGIYVYIKSFL